MATRTCNIYPGHNLDVAIQIFSIYSGYNDMQAGHAAYIQAIMLHLYPGQCQYDMTLISRPVSIGHDTYIQASINRT